MPDSADLLDSFDPSGLALGDGLFGLPHTPAQARLHLIPVPWEVTVSYRTGTAAAPEAIRAASAQVDLYDALQPKGYLQGLYLHPENLGWRERAEALRPLAAAHLEALMAGEATDADAPSEINAASTELAEWLKDEALALLKQGKLVAVLGGDHSTPLGLIQAIAKHRGSFGILQIDAHADLRVAYEGFTHSHASIMTNALQIPEVVRLVQVGLRDLGHSEVAVAEASNGRVLMFTQRAMVRKSAEGALWASQVQQIISALPNNVYVSFDIDGLDPSLCPNTGTPVPDGLGFEQVIYLIDGLVSSGRRIVGFDLNEVGIPPEVHEGQDSWDAIVGARVLYRLALAALASNPA